MPRLSVALLGPPEICHGDDPVHPPTRKALALLAYLAAGPGPHRREELVALLWPESDEEHARAALRRSLALLRQAIGPDRPHLIARRGSLELARADLALDVAVLDAALEPGAPLDSLAAASGAWRGDLLSGLSLADAPAFDEWLAARREVARAAMAQVWDRLSRAQLEAGSLFEAIATATRWLAAEPYEEVAYQRLMRAHLMRGDRGAALHAYGRCRRILESELGSRPAPETERLAERARRLTAPVAETSAEVEARLPLVGRDGPLAQLRAVYARAAEHGPQLIAIEGEPGIGKSRVLAEFVRWLRARDSEALVARAFETGAELPYQPLVEVVRRRLAGERDPEALLSPVWWSQLAVLLPEVEERVPGLPQRPSLDPSTLRARLFEAVARFVARLAVGPPLLLAIDDAHWMAPDTLAMLEYGARRWHDSRAPVVVLLVARDAPSPLASTLRVLGSTMPTTTIRLGGLDRDATAALVSAVRPARTIDAGQLHTETGGHPLFVVETLQYLADGGDPGSVPPRVRDLIAARLGQLSPRARELVLGAAVIGGSFDLEILRRLAELGELAFFDAFEELLAHRILVESGDRVAFHHDRVRQIAYEDTSDGRRRVLHRRVLDVLSEAGTSAADRLGHALAGDVAEHVGPLALAAGDEAFSVYALQDAAVRYEAARSFARLLSDVETRRLYDRLGRAYELMSKPERARDVYAALLRIARERAVPTLEVLALERLALLAVNSADPTAAGALLEEAHDLATRGGDTAGLAELELDLAHLRVLERRTDLAWAHVTRALALARSLDAAPLVARTLNRLAYILAMQNRWDELKARAQEAVEAYAAIGDPVLEADSLSLAARGQAVRGEHGAAIASAGRALQLSREIGNAWGVANAAKELAFARLERGELDAARADATAGVEAAKRSGYGPLVVLCLGILGAIDRAAGRSADARGSHEEALKLARAAPASPMAVLLREVAASELCADLVAAGEWHAAAQAAREARAARVVTEPFAVLTRPAEVEALLRVGDREAAEDLADLAEVRYATRRFEIPYLHALGLLARAHGEDAASNAHFEQAAAIAEELGLALEHRWLIAARGIASHLDGSTVAKLN